MSGARTDGRPSFQVIPSIRRLGDLEWALKSKRQTILLTGADIANLPLLAEKVHRAGKKVLINMELLGGFGRDEVGIKLLKHYFKVDGVMSTDRMRLGMARNIGLYTIQRFLISDSKALDTTLRILKSTRAQAAEILPAKVAVDVLPELRKVTAIPLWAGGFIQTPEEIEAVERAGFNGATTSERHLF